MWMDFGGELINMNAVSQIIKKEVNGGWYIELFRIDGSYMTSLVFSDEEDAEKALEEIKAKVFGGNTVNVCVPNGTVLPVKTDGIVAVETI